MDLLVLLTFASFFVALAVASSARHGVLGTSVGRPVLFRGLTLGAAALLVPVDLGAAFSEATGDAFGHGMIVTVLLLNVAACCGAAALHQSLRSGRARSGAPVDPDAVLRLGVLGWVGPLVALVALGVLVTIGPAGDGSELGAVGPVWAFYSVLICLISGYALLRRRAREASGPQEG
jgi:hypothetical protein